MSQKPENHAVSENKIQVLIVDDHPALRMGLVSVVNSQPDMAVVGEAASGIEAVERAVALRPGVVLMDLRMPNGSGFEAISGILAKLPGTRIVVLSTYDLEEDVFRALKAGAAAYVLKDSTMAEIVLTIRRASAGEIVIPPHLESVLGARLKREELTHREYEVLELIVKGKSNKDIASLLMIAEDTVKTHTRTLFMKLGVNARTEAAFQAVRSGLVHL